jgi:cysteine desulfurase
LVALSWVQHETGAIAPVRTVAEVARSRGGVVVLDAVQALGKVPVDLATTGAVAAALSAHKIGGPAGVGAAWLAAGLRLAPQLGGGGQEQGLRAGTENVLGVVGFGAAARDLAARLAAMPAVAARRDRIEGALLAQPGVVVNGAERPRVATACHVSVRGVAGEELVAALDLDGFCVSAGPACSSGRPGPSPSLRALYPDEPWRAASALRLTLGPETTDDEVEAFVAAIPRTLARVRG